MSISIVSKSNIETLAIGRFDGVHLGHHVLFKHLDQKGGVLVIEFDKGTLLTLHEEKKLYLKNPFFYNLEEIKSLSCKGFVRRLQKDFCHLKKIAVGYDFRFGKNRSGGVRELQKYFHGEVVVIEGFCIGGEEVRSSKITQFIKAGNLQKANRFLGRYYDIQGRIIQGQGLGTRHLLPTLNMHVDDKKLLPLFGVYATFCHFEGKKYKSATFLGVRNTDRQLSLETHLLGVHLKHPPKEACLEFIEFIRKNRKFETFEALKKQIESDCQICLQTLCRLNSLENFNYEEGI